MQRASIAHWGFALVGSWLVAASAQAADGGVCDDGSSSADAALSPCPNPLDAAAPEADASATNDASTPPPGSSADGGSDWVRVPRYTSKPPLPVSIDPNQAPPQSWPPKQNEPKSVEDAGAIPATDLEFAGGREKHACSMSPVAGGPTPWWAMLSAAALCVMRRRKLA